MITCPKCGSELDDNMKFCDQCGASLAEISDSPKPTAPVEEVHIEAAPVEKKPVAVAAVLQKLSKIPRKPLVLGAIGVAAVVVVVLLFSLIFGGKADNYALYLKDEELFFSELKKSSDPWQVTARLADDIDADELAYASGNIADYVYVTDDSKYIFFADKIDGGDGCNLYYREVGKKKDAVKIDSDVYMYTVNESASIVTYSKPNGTLYQYQIGKDEKEKVASGVAYDGSYFDVSKDGKKIVYVNEDYTLYLKEGKGDKEKLASDIDDLWYITEDYKTVYYTKDDSLYKQVPGKDKEKIASEVSNVIKIYDSGEAYYTVFDEDESSYALYYYDGKEEIKITDDCDHWLVRAQEEAVMTYTDTDGEMYVVAEGTAAAIDADESAGCFRINEEGTRVFYIDDISDDGEEGTLCTIEIKKGKIGKAEVYDEDVYTGWCTFSEDGSFLYFKDYKNDKGELYMDQEKIDDDVYPYAITVDKEGNVIYYTDWDDEDVCGTLKIFEGRKPEKIADDASSYTVTPDGGVLYLYDYSYKYGKGELYTWDNGKSRKLDEDVIALLPIIDYEKNRYRGFGW